MNFLNGEGKKVGDVSLQSPTITVFEANATAVMGNAALATAMVHQNRNVSTEGATRDGGGTAELRPRDLLRSALIIGKIETFE